MKSILFMTIVLVGLTIVNACSTFIKPIDEKIILNDTQISERANSAEFYFVKGSKFNHPSFVIWEEDVSGEFVKTIYLTKSYATGFFNQGALTDSTWKAEPGKSIQAAALPYWTHKKGLINGKVLIPTPDNMYVDAFTSATPKSSFTLNTAVKNSTSRLMVELNQPWDFNKYWTNAKLKNEWYKHSAQPSLIYSVEIHGKGEYYLNPIGHGSATGEDGNLQTNLSTLTTAKDIFKEIKVIIK